MLRTKPRDRKVRAGGPGRRSAYLGTDERSGRDYFLSGPHVFHVRASPASVVGGRHVTCPCAPLAAYNRLSKTLRCPTER